MPIKATSEAYGTVSGGQQAIQLVTLTDTDTGVTVKLTNYGATIVSFVTPDKYVLCIGTHSVRVSERQVWLPSLRSNRNMEQSPLWMGLEYALTESPSATE